MYYDFFGLERPPFRITPDTAFFFEGGNRGATLEALLYAIAQGEGIIKVTGEVGSGKTMLCRVVLNRLDQDVDVVYLANPSVAPDEILHAIAFELAIRLPADTSRVEVLHALQSYLVSRHAKGHQVVLFVEEAQRMPLETLEEIRLYELRHAEAVSQAELAGRLDVTQGAISKLEHSDDVRVSTLRQYLEALGARLEPVAVFDDEDRRVPIHLGRDDAA
jgi:type II secretory pathway predicted ATPase ExeA